STSLVLLPLPSFPTRRSSDLTPCNVASPIGRRSSTGIRRRPRGRGESFSPRSPGPANMFCRSIFHIRRRGSSRPTAHGSGTSLCDKQYLLGSLGHMSKGNDTTPRTCGLHIQEGRIPAASPLSCCSKQTFGLRLRLNQPTARTGRFIRLP